MVNKKVLWLEETYWNSVFRFLSSETSSSWASGGNGLTRSGLQSSATLLNAPLQSISIILIAARQKSPRLAGRGWSAWTWHHSLQDCTTVGVHILQPNASKQEERRVTSLPSRHKFLLVSITRGWGGLIGIVPNTPSCGFEAQAPRHNYHVLLYCTRQYLGRCGAHRKTSSWAWISWRRIAAWRHF